MNRFGYTTGTYAAAAAKAALSVLLGGKDLVEIGVTLPKGEKALIPVSFTEGSGDSVKCGVVKKSVEEADVTHNLEIFAHVCFREDDQIIIDGGEGIGRITKMGLHLPVGEAAINPIPRKMICSSMRELTPRGVDVIISAPRGVEVAGSTYNPRLGIIGGISIIGTTGIMWPKSQDSFKQTILQQLNFCRENGVKEIIITPGNISEEAMLTHFGDRIFKEQIVQAGDFLGFTLRRAFGMGFSLFLAGHPGKLAKVLGGWFQTHHSRSHPANNVVIQFFKDRIKDDILREMKESPTVEGITVILRQNHYGDLLNDLAEAIEEKVRKYLMTDLPIPILLFNMNKELIGASRAGIGWIKR